MDPADDDWMRRLAANVAVAEPTVTGRVIAAWPPFSLIAAYELCGSDLPDAGFSVSQYRQYLQLADRWATAPLARTWRPL